jgi:cellulose 1,4-beta-cellobiosidase
MVTNMNVAKCSKAAPYYKDLVAYAIKKLDFSNVSQYLDAGHAGWLGWDANIGPAAQLFGQIYKAAGSPKSVRGIVTNVSNYNAFRISTCPAITQGNKNCDEERYINALAPLLTAQGFPAHFIVDTGRSGKQPTGQNEWGDWCNVSGAGFGTRPTTNTGNTLVDAFVWVKPGGEVRVLGDPTTDEGANDVCRPMELRTRLRLGMTALVDAHRRSSRRLRRGLGSRRTLRCC